MKVLREDRENLFATLCSPASISQFFDRVAEDVDWTIEGTHPISGHYSSKGQVLTEALGRLNRMASGQVRLELTGLVVDGSTVVAELRSIATGLDGRTYDNGLCWICRFDSAEPGASITEVREYLDSAMIMWMMASNEHRRPEG